MTFRTICPKIKVSTALLDRLTEEDRELLLEYMDVVGNMQYRITQLAWLYGKLHPHE